MTPIEKTRASQPCYRLRCAREISGLTQAELAERAGISPSVVCRLEHSEGLASASTLIRMADALDVSIDYLLGRADNPEMADHTARLEQGVAGLSVSNRTILPTWSRA